MADRRIIGITGAAGFVGRHLARELAGDAEASLRLWGRTAGETVAGVPVTPLQIGPEAFEGVDAVVHLAGATDPRLPEAELLRANVTLAVDVVEAAIQAGVRRFVYFSSIAVHGRSSVSPIGPDTAFAPVNAYGRSKVAAERAVTYANRNGPMKLVIIRPPMIYGPGATGSFNALLKIVRSGLPLPFGAARAARSFCAVQNVVSATLAAIQHTNPPPEAFLPADPDDFSTRALVESMARAANARCHLLPAPPVAMKLMLGAAGRKEIAASLFAPLQIDRDHWSRWGWRPTVSGEAAVAGTVARLMELEQL